MPTILRLLPTKPRDAKNDQQYRDAHGRERPEWARAVMQRPLRSRRVEPETWTGQPRWAELIRSLAAHLEDRGEPLILAALRLD